MPRYIIQCRHCGAILFKTKDPIVAILRVEIKCPNFNCGKTLILPDDVIANLEKEKRAGLEKSR